MVDRGKAWRKKIETTGVGVAMLATLAFTFTGSIGLAGDVKAGRQETAELRDDIEDLKEDVGTLAEVSDEIKDLASARNDILEAIDRVSDQAIDRAVEKAVEEALKRAGR